MALRDTFLNMLGVETQEVQKTDNSVFKSARDFLRNGNRDKLYPSWSDIRMSDSDMYRGYSYAVIQKRGNKVASLAKNNLKTWANPDIVDEFQKKNEEVVHPYLKLIEDSTDFTEKQFWKNISIYLDLAGRYYLGVIRNEVRPLNPNLPVITTDPTKFIMLNPYEIRRVVDKNGQVAGYIEKKKDGRYREWPKHQIIEMRELDPFDPENSQWAMTDAAKNAVYTINQSGDYTRQSLNGNIDAPGIITTDVLLNDEDFANFRARITQHTKGEPLFGNGTGAINWDSMQIDLDKAALLDINEINRTELFAVSGTSKTSLGIEQSGTTRETARVQSEQFVSDTAQPRLEDIVDFLNLDYKKHYNREYRKTGYSIDVESSVAKDYDTSQKAVQLKQSQFQLAMTLIQSGYTEESAWQFAEGEIEHEDLELEKGLDKPKNPENPSEEEGSDKNSPKSPKNGPQSGSRSGSDKSSVSKENSLGSDFNELEPHGDLVANGGPGSGNFGHEGRPGLVGGSGDGGLTSFEEEISAIDNPDILYKKQEGLVTTEVVSCLEKDSDSLTEEEKDVLKEFYDKTNLLRKKLFKLEGSDIEKADKKISEWISGSLDWEFRNIDFDPVDIRLSKSTVQGMLDKESELIAYRIQATDRMEKSKGSSFSLSEAFSESSPDSETPYVFAQKVTKENTILTPNIVQAGYGYELGPNWQHEIVLPNDKELMPINNSVEGEKCNPLEVLEVENGGKGSGNFGHSGRPGEVGGSSNTSYTQDEEDAVLYWKQGNDGWGYSQIRAILRGQTPAIVQEQLDLQNKEKAQYLQEGLEKIAKDFKSAVEKAPQAEGNLMRVSGDFTPHQVGDIVDFDSYTSFSKNLPEHTVHDLGAEGTNVFRLPAKEGHKDISKVGKSHADAESEVVNDKKLSYQVERISEEDIGGRKYKVLYLSNKEQNHYTCEHDHKVETVFNALGEDSSKFAKEKYDEFLDEIRAIEKETVNACARKVDINAFEESDIIGKRKKKTLTEKLKNAIHKYWWAVFPLFAVNSMNKRNAEFDEDVSFVFNNDLQTSVDDNAERVAQGHMETILNDVLEASNRAYTNVQEEAAAELIVKAYKVDPNKYEEYFDHEPTMADALSSIRKTDILEKNRKIYEKANKMAFEGYNRRDIIKAIRDEYKDISEKRAETIVRNETSRAFTHSQFESDKQFLNSIGKLDQAYKQLVSTRPANEADKICPVCQALIDKGPVPFNEPFLEYGNSIEVQAGDKVQIFTANYESIEGGTVHVNCFCTYELVFKNDAGEFVKTLNQGEKETQNGTSNSVDSSGSDSRNNSIGGDAETTKSVNGKGKGWWADSENPHIPGSQGGIREQDGKYIVDIGIVNPLYPISTRIFDDKATAIRYSSGYKAGLLGRIDVPTSIESIDDLYHLAYEDKPEIAIPGTKRYKTRAEVETVRAGFNDARDYRKNNER